MAQTRRQSIIEAILNVFSGMVIVFGVSQLAYIFEAEIQKYIWTGFEWHISTGSNILVMVVLAIISVVRGYAWRRHFNKKSLRGTR